MPKATLTLGAKILEVDSDHKTVNVEFDAKGEYPNWSNQGGFLAAMLDNTMAPALTATLNDNQFAPTLELKTTFIAPAKVGKIYEQGPVVFKGCSVCVVEGELTQDGKLVARSTATALIRRISKWL